MSARPEQGALAIVLHTHMPYVEGFGTWPFGEEWLWEAIACSYLPLLELLDRGAPLTLSLTPVLCDQLETPDLGERLARFVAEVRRMTHARDAAGLRAGGHDRLAAEVERASCDYERALAWLQSPGGSLLSALAPHASWTSAASHAVLPLIATDAGLRLQVQSGIASHRRRFAEPWRGGFWLPECAYAPWLLRTLEDAGVRSVCVELTGRYGLGAPEHLAPLQSDSGVRLVPVDRATMALVWSEHGYPSAGGYRDYHHHTVHHHHPWSNDGEPYRREHALALALEHAADFVARVRARLRDAAGAGGVHLPGGGLVVCALDTELLGHWWYEGPAWLEAVVEECSRQGLELVRLDDALERGAIAVGGGQLDRPGTPSAGASGAGAISWGSGGDLSTWSAPVVAEMAFAARAAELRLLSSSAPPSDEAVRELIALQASDWPFMVSRGIAVPYARARFAGHLGSFEHALAGEREGVRTGLRNLAVDARGESLLAPL